MSKEKVMREEEKKALEELAFIQWSSQGNKESEKVNETVEEKAEEIKSEEIKSEAENKIEETVINSEEEKVNEEVINEEKSEEVINEAENIEDKEIENKEPENEGNENQINISSEGEETAGETENKSDAETEKKKRNISKRGDKEWATKIPEAERFNNSVIVCFRPGELDKIGQFEKYGAKEGMLWVQMFKKDSTDFSKGSWTVLQNECEIVKGLDGVLNPNYVEENGIFYTKKKYDEKKEKEVKRAAKLEKAKKEAEERKAKKEAEDQAKQQEKAKKEAEAKAAETSSEVTENTSEVKPENEINISSEDNKESVAVTEL